MLLQENGTRLPNLAGPYRTTTMTSGVEITPMNGGKPPYMS